MINLRRYLSWLPIVDDFRTFFLTPSMESLGFKLKREASLNTLTNDVVKFSVIKGEILTLAMYAHLLLLVRGLQTAFSII